MKAVVFGKNINLGKLTELKGLISNKAELDKITLENEARVRDKVEYYGTMCKDSDFSLNIAVEDFQCLKRYVKAVDDLKEIYRLREKYKVK